MKTCAAVSNQPAHSGRSALASDVLPCHHEAVTTVPADTVLARGYGALAVGNWPDAWRFRRGSSHRGIARSARRTRPFALVASRRATHVAAADQQVLITRIFEAPREQVFKAWTDPDQVAAWYGPEHFDTPRERIHIDLRLGGRYELTMVQRDSGAEFTIGYEIVELVEPELIVLRSDPMPEVGMHEPTITRVEFNDHGAKTRMTLSDGPYPAGRDHAEAGWTAAFDNLAALVAG
jgi:uncharacterized protein YndB with AHSA1/START domain